MDGEEVSQETLRQLRSSFPYDTKTAVSFVSGGSQEGLRTVLVGVNSESEGESTAEEEGKLTGIEAKEFYEEVLSLPERKVTVGTKTFSSIRSRHPKRELRKVKKVAHKSSSSSIKTSFQLFQCVQNNELEEVQLALSKQDFGVNIQDNFGWTMLMVAACAGHVEIVQHLLRLDANWRDYAHKGMNAADLARSKGYYEIADLIESSGNQDSHSDGEEERISTPSSEPIIAHQETYKYPTKRPRREESFFCDSCKMTVNSSHEGAHSTSIVHLYSDPHQHSSRTSYGIPESNRGFQMLLRSGWDRERGLGPQRQGHKFPVKTVLKQDRLGLGLGEKKPRVTHFSAHDKKAVQTHRDRFKKAKTPKKKDILQEKKKDSQWERRLRTATNIEDSHLLT